jgi:MEMO1 family protein
MQTLFVVLLSIFIAMEPLSHNTTTNDRQPVAAGRFYPADKNKLLQELNILFHTCRKPASDGIVRAIISPHAGYIYSGRITASAFSAIPEKTAYKNIFIIGSSHVMYFNGASVYNSGDYITPLGRAVVNKDIANRLILANKVFDFPVDAHIKEHSIENQVPFIQYYFKYNPPIVPIIIGTDDQNTIKKIAEALRPYFVPENLFIISSDFSHYPSYQDAITNDSLTATAIISCKPKVFLNTLKDNSQKNIQGLATSMCGWSSGLSLLYLGEGNNDLTIKRVDYCNSGDEPGTDKREVVGYNALVMYEKLKHERSDEQQDVSFTKEEKKTLFSIARSTIEEKLFPDKKYKPDESSVTETLKQPMGAFVTLKINGSLRGCIGRFPSPDPLYNVVHESAYSSAFEDPRFSPLTKDDYPKTEMEITVLGPLKKIKDKSEIILGKHGIYIKKGTHSGTMLPQVAVENNWTVDEFLGYTSSEKAGLGWNGWKDAEIFIYEGIVLHE